MATVDEFQEFLNMDSESLEEAVISAVTDSEEFVTQFMRVTVPATPVEDYLQTISRLQLKEDVFTFIHNDFDRTKDDLYKLVCEKLKYCKLRKDNAEVTAGMAICFHYAALAHPALWAIPAVVAYLQRNRFFDKLCGCNN